MLEMIRAYEGSRQQAMQQERELLAAFRSAASQSASAHTQHQVLCSAYRLRDLIHRLSLSGSVGPLGSSQAIAGVAPFQLGDYQRSTPNLAVKNRSITI